MELFDLPHSEARVQLQSGAPVYLPVNPVEYHGPHLPLRNDALISDGLIADLHAALQPQHPEWPLLRASHLELGAEPTAGPGSRHIRPGLLGAQVREACRALAELGARRVVLVTFHGAPLHAWALEEGVTLLGGLGVQAYSPLNLVTEKLLEPGDLGRYAPAYADIEDPAEREEMLRTLPRDFHAGFFETSVALHYAPRSVAESYTSLPPCPPVESDAALLGAAKTARRLGRERLALELELAAHGMGWARIRPWLGYTGRPHRATAAAGAVFAREMVALFAARAEEIFAGRATSPRPILGWLRAASRGGRLGSTAAVRLEER